jgi:hypothetical protein
MSVRRRAVQSRVERARQLDDGTRRLTVCLSQIQGAISAAVDRGETMVTDRFLHEAFGSAPETPVARCDGQCLFGAAGEHRLSCPAHRASYDPHGAPVVAKGHFWRGVPESNRHQCRNCGRHYDEHHHTDEASRCPL